MSQQSFTEEVSLSLGLSHCVEVRHLPHYTRFTSTVSFTAVGQVTRSYSPVSLASLASTLVVANTTPERLQR
jgi:hypothetical protein